MTSLRATLASVLVGAAAALCVTAGAASGTAAPEPAAPVTAAAPVPAVAATQAPMSSSAPTRPVTSAPRTTTRKAVPATTTTKRPAPHRRSTTTSGSGCAKRALARGVFDPSCAEYQGYLDPGRAGGRAPSSGDIQSDWAECTATKSDAQCREELN